MIQLNIFPEYGKTYRDAKTMIGLKS